MADNELLECVTKECMDNGVAVVVAKYLPEELKMPPARWLKSHFSNGIPEAVSIQV